jgi:hypothetical protein
MSTIGRRAFLGAVLAGTAGVRAAWGEDAAQPVVEEGFRALFDGKTLEGWLGEDSAPERAWFRVEEGAIVGGTLEKPVPHNAFLCHRDIFVNFDLRLQCRLMGDDPNAGIQFRSKRVGEYEMMGYQADLGQQYWGCLYDEERRKKVLVQPPPEVLARAVKAKDWNDYRILCEGQRVQLWLNGVQTVDYTEADTTIQPVGLIGLQIHSGPPTEAWYRNIRIKVV